MQVDTGPAFISKALEEWAHRNGVKRDVSRPGTPTDNPAIEACNRIEWISPGGLPPGITVENLLDEQWSRNPIILSILYEAGYVEAFGQGLNTVVMVLQANGMSEPVFRDTGASFMVIVYGRAKDNFVGGDLSTRLTTRQREIYEFIQTHKKIPARDIIERFGGRLDARTIQRDLQALIDAALIAREGWGRSILYYDPTAEEK